MDSNLDLDIRNYNLEDITNLFKIPIVFTETDLRTAKLMVLHTHPDKSKLPKDYFLFFLLLFLLFLACTATYLYNNKRQSILSTVISKNLNKSAIIERNNSDFIHFFAAGSGKINECGSGWIRIMYVCM